MMAISKKVSLAGLQAEIHKLALQEKSAKEQKDLFTLDLVKKQRERIKTVYAFELMFVAPIGLFN